MHPYRQEQRSWLPRASPLKYCHAGCCDQQPDEKATIAKCDERTRARTMHKTFWKALLFWIRQL